MIRNLKAVGLAVFSLLAMTAVAAPSASAGVFHLSAESTVLTGEALNTQMFMPTPAEEEFKCEKVSVEKGTVVGKTVEKVTIKPKYEGCTILSGETEVSTTVELTECAYEFTSSTNETGHGKLRLECPNEGEHIHFKVTSLNLKCMEIPAQEVTGVRYENTGETTEFEQKTLDFNVTASGLVTTTKGACGSELHDNGTYNGTFKAKGKNTISEPTDVSYG